MSHTSRAARSASVHSSAGTSELQHFKVWGNHQVAQGRRLKLDLKELLKRNELCLRVAERLNDLTEDDEVFFLEIQAGTYFVIGIRDVGSNTTDINDIIELTFNAAKTAVWPYDQPRPVRLV
jgi:hypothetical protein